MPLLRAREPFQGVQCIACGNKYCAPTASDQVDAFICATCSADVSKGLLATGAQLADLIAINPGLMGCFSLPSASRKVVFERISLFKLWMGQRGKLERIDACRPEYLTWAGKPVKNVSEVVDELVDKVLYGRLSETCNLCFEERALPALQSACGLCDNLACADCLKRWYGQLAPGRLYVPSEGLCPFCKRTPKAKTLQSFNRLACRLAGRGALELRADMHYGWCRACFRIAEAVPRECAREAPALHLFECGGCKEQRLAAESSGEAALRRATKQCPACKEGTVKISGCNHISCPCGAHWCWRCGRNFEESVIYDHMNDVHGGIGFGDGEGDFSDGE